MTDMTIRCDMCEEVLIKDQDEFYTYDLTTYKGCLRTKRIDLCKECAEKWFGMIHLKPVKGWFEP